MFFDIGSHIVSALHTSQKPQIGLIIDLIVKRIVKCCIKFQAFPAQSGINATCKVRFGISYFYHIVLINNPITIDIFPLYITRLNRQFLTLEAPSSPTPFDYREVPPMISFHKEHKLNCHHLCQPYNQEFRPSFCKYLLL